MEKILLFDTLDIEAIKLAKGVVARQDAQPLPLSNMETRLISSTLLKFVGAWKREHPVSDDPHDRHCADCDRPEVCDVVLPGTGPCGKNAGTAPDYISGQPHTSKANERQVAGNHYGLSSLQHWDLVAMFNWDYFQGQITKYLMRWRKKNGVQDLRKAAHFLEKYIELVEQKKIT